MAWTLREHQKEPHRLAHLLYWQQARGPEGAEDVIYQNDHSFLNVLCYRGVDVESADAHELMALRARAHAVLLTLGGGWMVQNEVRRHKAAPYPVSTWAHPVAALVDEERREARREANRRRPASDGPLAARDSSPSVQPRHRRRAAQCDDARDHS